MFFICSTYPRPPSPMFGLDDQSNILICLTTTRLRFFNLKWFFSCWRFGISSKEKKETRKVIKNDQIHLTWYWFKCGLFDDRDLDGLEVRVWLQGPRCLTSRWRTSSPCRSTSSWRRWRRKGLPDWNGYNSTTGVVLIKTILDYQNDKDCYWHYGRSIGAFKNIRMHIIIKQEGDKNEVE